MNGFKEQPISKHELETIEILVSTGRYFKRLQFDIYLLKQQLEWFIFWLQYVFFNISISHHRNNNTSNINNRHSNNSNTSHRRNNNINNTSHRLNNNIKHHRNNSRRGLLSISRILSTSRRRLPRPPFPLRLLRHNTSRLEWASPTTCARRIQLMMRWTMSTSLSVRGEACSRISRRSNRRVSSVVFWTLVYIFSRSFHF